MGVPRYSVEFIREHFALEGETVFHKATGNQVTPTPGRKGYAQISVKVAGTLVVLRLHRVKFALAHGYLPPRVDHRDRDIKNDTLANLRPATVAQNAANTGCLSASRGVRRAASGRYKAYGTKGGRQVHLGTYDTQEGARAAANAFRKETQGEFYVGD